MESQTSEILPITKAWLKLKEVDPKNPLLVWMADEDNMSEEDFKDRFWSLETPREYYSNDVVTRTVLLNYLVALETELEKQHIKI